MILQIWLAVPIAFFFYLAFGLQFQMLNLIGLFIIVALGADDVFVASEKWKASRCRNPMATTEDIAKMVIPDAASAMLLTTLTTAFGFFSAAFSNVALISSFVTFTGLLILFNYIMCVFLFLPSLVLRDKWEQDGKK